MIWRGMIELSGNEKGKGRYGRLMLESLKNIREGQVLPFKIIFKTDA